MFIRDVYLFIWVKWRMINMTIWWWMGDVNTSTATTTTGRENSVNCPSELRSVRVVWLIHLWNIVCRNFLKNSNMPHTVAWVQAPPMLEKVSGQRLSCHVGCQEVALEVNLRNLLRKWQSFETQGRHHENSRTGLPLVSQKWLVSSKLF